MDKDIFKGIKIGFGFILFTSIFFGLAFAVGFHTPNEILSGVFLGNYTFSGSVDVNEPVTGSNPATKNYVDSSINSNSDKKLINKTFVMFNANDGDYSGNLLYCLSTNYCADNTYSASNICGITYNKIHENSTLYVKAYVQMESNSGSCSPSISSVDIVSSTSGASIVGTKSLYRYFTFDSSASQSRIYPIISKINYQGTGPIQIGLEGNMIKNIFLSVDYEIEEIIE